MAAQYDSALSTANTNNVVNQTAPESITPTILGNNVIQAIIDSKWSRADDLLTLPPVLLSKGGLAACIAAGTLVLRTNGLSDKQWIKITDRTDGNPLLVQTMSANTLSPFGIWIKGGKALGVIMDYANGYDGEANPFIAVFDENRQLAIPDKIIISDSSKGADKVLVSDANGQGTWTALAYYMSGIINPALISSSGSLRMNGLAGSITPTKTGRCLITVCGEYTSDAIPPVTTSIGLRTGTGTAPANGDVFTGTSWGTKILFASSATLRIPFVLSVMVTGLTPGTPYWIDIASCNNGAGNVQIFNTTISAMEQ